LDLPVLTEQQVQQAQDRLAQQAAREILVQPVQLAAQVQPVQLVQGRLELLV
jgi:hypothetical protein